MKRLAYATITSMLMIAAATSQETGNARSGEEVRVGWIGSVGDNCKPNPAPEVKPSSVAGHGQIKLTRGEVQTNSIPQCPGVKIPAIVVFYRSSQAFEGEDRFVLSVKNGDRTTERTYVIRVGRKTAPIKI